MFSSSQLLAPSPPTHLCIHKVCKIREPLLVTARLKRAARLADDNGELLTALAVAAPAEALGLQVAKCLLALLPEGLAQKGGHGDAGWVNVGGHDRLHVCEAGGMQGVSEGLQHLALKSGHGDTRQGDVRVD